MAAPTTPCAYTILCIHDTGFPQWDDTYTRSGSYNGNYYYIGNTNGYVIFLSDNGWCLSDYIDGQCFLSGKSCYRTCPDFCDDYFTNGVCPPPEPPPVNPCEIIDFEAIFNCDVPVPTPSATPQCGGTLTTSATPPTAPIQLEPDTDIVYTNQGTIFHSPFNLDGTSPGNIYLAVSTTQPVWKRITSADGPLNRTGLWTNLPNDEPYDQWLGFSVCVNVPENKTYWVGLAGDNNFRIAIDGVTIVNTIGGPYDDDTLAFVYWHVYPVTLTAGNHVIELFGLNNSSDGAFGCEIYNNTIEELTGATQVSDLNILFTSSGQTEATIIQDLSGQYLASGYTCPTGYTFDPCTISCFQIIPPCTPTPTPTPSATVACPLSVNATIESFTPTPTRTPAITPSVSQIISRDCCFSGDVTFNTINSTIDSPISLEFQDCYNGSSYYTVNQLVRPEGGSLERFMIYQATVDGLRKCISYVGVSQNIIGANNITFISNLIGYSNLGQCTYCLEILTPTPTPTPSITPTITVSSTSNKPPAPDPSNTPTPTKTKPVFYYTYEKCGTNIRVCQPIEAYFGQTVNTVFKTGGIGDFANSCWSLISVTLTCSVNNPNYTTITYTTNAFPSVINTLYSNCPKCISGNNGTSPIQSSSPTPTPTVTPTKTNPPQAQSCKPHTVKISNQACAACNNTISTITTVYSPSDYLVPGVQVYSNSTCTTPLLAAKFILPVSASDGSVDGPVFVTGGQGVLNPYSCSNC